MLLVSQYAIPCRISTRCWHHTCLRTFTTEILTNQAQVHERIRSDVQDRLPPIPSVRDILKLYKLNALKKLSQNFLLDYKLTNRIVKSAGKITNCYVCEVGPGPGGITRSIIARNPAGVVLIEKDQRFAGPLKILQQSCPPDFLQVYWGDVMSFQMGNMFPRELSLAWDDKSPNIKIIGNLPFSVSTPLIIKWLKAISERSNVWTYGRVHLLLTFQLEVAQRLVAEVGNEQRSRLSIMAQYLCLPFHKFTIKGSAFVPKPDVDVGVVKFIPRKDPLIKQEFSLVERVVRHTFSMRRKHCSRGLSTLFPEMVRVHFTDALFHHSGVNPKTRPYDLSVDDFSKLCDAYAQITLEHPSLKDYEYRGFRPEETWVQKYGHAYDSYTRTTKQLTYSVETDDVYSLSEGDEESTNARVQ